LEFVAASTSTSTSSTDKSCKFLAGDADGFLRAFTIGTPNHNQQQNQHKLGLISKMTYQQQAHSGAITSIYTSNLTLFDNQEAIIVITSAVGGVVKCWNAGRKNGELFLFSYFLAQGEVTSCCSLSLVEEGSGIDSLFEASISPTKKRNNAPFIVCCGFESGVVESRRIVKNENDVSPLTNSQYHASCGE